ncbi:protein TIFY 5A [Eutrema salsugineum]|uniref:protein TIFY 5A n=1 Tax=Eutrema salsugineum TaxID=72664 RepID=UPI000CED32F0|nr:protein TIFY 5A [Eutrema salsugineum]
MKMHKNCDLELRLFPTSSYKSDSNTSVVESRSSQLKEESQRITIFYNGQMCVSSDVTKLQAKSIISIASREMEERSSRFYNQLSTNPKASMKKSLQSFLQKRKIRIQATSPYHQHSRR